MLIKKTAAFFILLTLIPSLFAHEFWLNPQKFIYKRTDKINIRFLVGEDFEGDNWQGNSQRINSLKIYFSGVSDDLTPALTEASGDSVEYTMIDEGTNLIAFNSNNSFIDLEPGAFNEYLEDDGLFEALEYRKKNNELGCNGREFYQRCAKTLVQVGDVKDQTFGITTGLPVDIIPFSNPYLLKNKEKLKVKILYKKSPLANALVKVWHRKNGETKKMELESNANGEVVFPVTLSGKWMISTVKMDRVFDNPVCDWQSYWGSLTWGYE